MPRKGLVEGRLRLEDKLMTCCIVFTSKAISGLMRIHHLIDQSIFLGHLAHASSNSLKGICNLLTRACGPAEVQQIEAGSTQQLLCHLMQAN